MLIAIFWSPLLAHYDSIFQGINTLISYIVPPITTVFLWGILSKKASAYGAKMTLYLGSLFGLIIFIIDRNKNVEWLTCLNYDIQFMIISFCLFILSSIVLLAGSYYKPHFHTKENSSLIWNKSFLILKEETDMKNRIFVISTIVLLLTIIVLLIIF